MCFTAITIYATGDKIRLNMKAESGTDSIPHTSIPHIEIEVIY